MKLLGPFDVTVASRVLSVALCLILSSAAGAHMPWLATDDEGHAVLWFGESPADRTYHMPGPIAAIQLSSGQTTLATTEIDSDALIGLRSTKPIDPTHEIAGSVTYGLYHDTKLTYHVEHLPHLAPGGWPDEPRSDAPLQSIITASNGGGIQVTVLRDGKPADGLQVKLYCEDGHEEASDKTDIAGIVTFKQQVVEPGLGAIVVGVTDEQASGTLDGKRYGSTTDYLTATFRIPGKSSSSAPKERPKREPQRPVMETDSSVSIGPAPLPDLPKELTSFGAAIADQTLYVYGGHTGDAHSYSTAEQSDRFWSLDLTAGKTGQWKSLPGGPSLQGLALVAYQNRLIRIGGFTAVNELGEEHDLRSQASVASYDPASNAWTDLPPLPEARSSLDAAVLGDRVYVFGGWKLDGKSAESQWHSTAWSLDLSDSAAQWQPVATPPFKRRAISVAAHDGKLYVIGGMSSDGKPTTRVDVYDPKADSWNQAPSLPGRGMLGFGAASFASGKTLYVSTMDGMLHRLSGDGQRWETIAKSDRARFFHRMLPTGEGALLMVGGADMEIGKFTTIDRIQIGD
ncbi:N-acetylneuraminate epimerase precursor [Stieleria neptunia]|uniref:N-acetylneuraminate epimerase n=1 Tax=Stieleria neptunia TaxID=2527979 RepID=A0A518HUV2_9BACT|nr:kelch repeat-containing protein [Stieleria neptunia]QDV44626.1 N-acetylneuraminate epimerase precursor [Stieleria neptunia]